MTTACASIACDVLLRDCKVSMRPEAILAREEVLQHVVRNSAADENEDEDDAEDLGTGRGIKRQLTPDAKLTKKVATSFAKGHMRLPGKISALNLSYDLQLAKSREMEESLPACQVCHLARDKWTVHSGEALYLNARNEPVHFPLGSFCSKACFEHI